jgi:hypothetical protein
VGVIYSSGSFFLSTLIESAWVIIDDMGWSTPYGYSIYNFRSKEWTVIAFMNWV